MQDTDRYLSATEAAKRLGVSKATLYAYVSRGLIRSVPGEDNSRARRYAAADVEALLNRKQGRRDPGSVAAAALDFGEPVLASAITLIQDGHLYYRGHDAIALAQTASFEAVTCLLWRGQFEPQQPALDSSVGTDVSAWTHSVRLPAEMSALERLQALLPVAQARDPQAYMPTPALIEQVGLRTMQLLVAVSGGAPATADTTPALAAQLVTGWHLMVPDAVRLVDAALILAADHEFNISSFTARCVASAGATPYAAISAALGAMQGTRHGGQSLRSAAFLREVAREGPNAVRNRLRRGESLPGFGHRLYPDGDPRGRLLLDLAYRHSADTQARTLVETTVDEVVRQTGLQPNIDFGLVALAHTLALPDEAPLILFTLGRLAGWVGQIIEQHATGQLIRPRARYTGPLPDAQSD